MCHGQFIESGSVTWHCILLAQGAFLENNVPTMAALVACVHMATEMDEGSKTLMELLFKCRVAANNIKTELEERVVMALSAILSGMVALGKVFLAHEDKFLFPRQTSRMRFLSRQGTPVGAAASVQPRQHTGTGSECRTHLVMSP